MPTYEYACAKGHQFESFHRISDPPVERCPTCNAKARRLISSGNFILKGGGWYSDLYSSAGKKASSTASSSAGEGATTAPASASAPTTTSPTTASAPAPAKGERKKASAV